MAFHMENFMNNNDFTSRPVVSVNGFCLARPEMLLQIKDYFGLLADPALLGELQRHFATVQRREPTSEELVLLDRFFVAEPTDPGRFVLTSLSSDDPRIGETYDDLRAKANELDKRLPLNLTELFEFGGHCLSSVGHRAPARERIFSGRDALIRSCIRDGSSPALISSPDVCAALDLSTEPTPKSALQTDLLVYVSGPDKSFVAALASLIISGRGRFNVGAVALADNGLLNALLELTPGGLIDLTVLPELSLLSLVERTSSAAFLTLNAATLTMFVREAGRFGLTARACGRTDGFKRLSIVTGSGMPLNVSTEFLKSGAPRFALTAEVVRRETKAVDDKGFDIATADASGHSRNVAAMGARAVTAVGANELSFDASCLTLIEGVSRLVAAGASYKDICASVELRLGRPNDAALVGDSVGALLGLYRVQAELCLRTTGGRVDFGEAGLGALMTAPLTDPLPDTLQSPGSRVYLLAPRADGYGLPRFSDLRRLYEYFDSLVKNGEVLSARAVGRTGLDATVEACSVEHPLYLVGEKNTEFALGGLIVESENELDGYFLGLCE